MASRAFTVAVLAGGASRRMGRTKATLRVGRHTLLSRVVEAAEAAEADVIAVIGGEPSWLGATEGRVRHVPDRWPGQGPLGGIVTALDAIGAENGPVVVVPCDLAAPSPDALRLVASAVRGPVQVAVPVVDNRDQWLHAAWAPATLTDLEERFRAGARAVAAGADGLEVARIELDPSDVADVDDPDAYQALLTRHARRAGGGTGRETT